MSLKLMYITNDPDVAVIAEKAGVDRIFVDMEYIGKENRQANMDSVKNHHTIDDIKNLRKVLCKSELMVRINPIHDKTDEYTSSEEEINDVIESGADLIMLPYFKTLEEVIRCKQIIAGRARLVLLLETSEAVDIVDDIISEGGFDEVHIGINDLSLSYGKHFMFQLLPDGTIEKLCLKFKLAGITYGFGGIASLGNGVLPAELIIKEHYRLNSSMVILSRSFCDYKAYNDYNELQQRFIIDVKNIRSFEREIRYHSDYFNENTELIRDIVNEVVSNKKK